MRRKLNFARCGSGWRHAVRKSVRVLRQHKSLLNECVHGALALVRMVLRVFVTLLKRESRISAGQAFLLRGGKRDERTGQAAQFAGGKSFGAQVPAGIGGDRNRNLRKRKAALWISIGVYRRKQQRIGAAGSFRVFRSMHKALEWFELGASASEILPVQSRSD